MKRNSLYGILPFAAWVIWGLIGGFKGTFGKGGFCIAGIGGAVIVIWFLFGLKYGEERW